MVRCPTCGISHSDMLRDETFEENGFTIQIGYFKCVCGSEFCTRFLSRESIINEEIAKMRRDFDDKFTRYIKGIKRLHGMKHGKER